MDLDRGAGGRRGADHDPARGQGAGVPAGLPARLGGRRLPLASARMDEKGEKGLEEERRLAYVGITRAREEARISFAANRQVYGRWTSQLPSRFVDELPLGQRRGLSRRPATTAAARACSRHGSRWDDDARRSAPAIPRPGWKRAQASASYRGSHARPQPVIEGEGRLVATSDPSAGQRLQARRPRLPPEVRLRRGHAASRATSSPSPSTRPARRRSSTASSRSRAEAHGPNAVYIMASGQHGTLYIGVTSDLLGRVGAAPRGLRSRVSRSATA